MMLILNVCSSATLYAADAPASGSNPPRRNTTQWNLDAKTKLAITGYDLSLIHI